MKFTKKDLKPIIVLGVICLVTAVLIAGINMITAPVVAAAEEKAIQDSLKDILPTKEYKENCNFINLTDGKDDNDNEEIKSRMADTTVTAVYQDVNSGIYAVTLSTSKGYTGNAILLTIGIDNEGRVTGAIVTSNPESKETNRTDAYFIGFKDKNPMEIDEIGKDAPELVAGVTYSTAAVRNAAYDAFKVLGFDVPEVEAKEPVGEYTVWSTVGICIVVAAIGCSVAYIIVKRRKGI